ncbi:MAG: metallophosphoesterase [Myxococcaceae bacterium]|nr:metallophosphoesterase [Myxococcaceae bacterium]
MRISPLVLVAVGVVLSLSCGGVATGGGEGGGSPGGAGGGSQGGTCAPCVESADCGADEACVQYAGADYCGKICNGSGCAAGESCTNAVAEDGTQFSVCVPTSGTCPDGTGCGVCENGQVCDVIAGDCVDPEDDAGIDIPVEPEPDAGEEPDVDAGPVDAGRADAGRVDAGRPDAGPPRATGVGPDGGTVAKLYFAVVGDTRPPGSNDTAHYPTAIITKIYDQIQAMNPRPQFVVTTGDYMFANATQGQGEIQIQKYLSARDNYKGMVFAAMGNHECSGGTKANCAGVTTNKNYNSFLKALVKPLNKKPNYAIPIRDVAGKWTAKLIIISCNSWTAADKAWLTTTLAQKTTYTFLARHEPLGTDAPCGAPMDALLRTNPYNLLMVGHVHQYSHSGKQLLEGVGGAPLTGNDPNGYATVEQLAAGGFRIRQYNVANKQVISTFTVP